MSPRPVRPSLHVDTGRLAVDTSLGSETLYLHLGTVPTAKADQLTASGLYVSLIHGAATVRDPSWLDA